MLPNEKLQEFISQKRISVSAFRKMLDPEPSKQTVHCWLSGEKAPTKNKWVVQIESLSGITSQEWELYKIQKKKAKLSERLENMVSL